MKALLNFLALCLFLPRAGLTAAEPEQTKPNILVILADDP